MSKINKDKQENKKYKDQKVGETITAFRDLLDTELQTLHDAHGGFSMEIAVMQVLIELKKVKDKIK